MTTWWNNNVELEIESFKEWTRDHFDPTKMYCRKHVADHGYKSIIDCGCGLATEYFGYKADNYDIDYTGLDSCKFFIKLNDGYGIKMIDAELESTLPIEDNSFDCVYCREVIEHLSYYEHAISEFIRIGRKEIIIVWFLKPGTPFLQGDELPESLKKKPLPLPGSDQINYWKEEDLYHNVYDINKLQDFIRANPKVQDFRWQDFDAKKSVLHITLREYR